MDPETIGRVRVRCFGWHTEDKTLVPTDTLPWAHIITPPNMPASYTCREGDYVFGFFVDGRSAQHPIIVGVLPGKPAAKPDYNLGFSDPNKRYPKRVGESTFSRLATAEEKYPYNWVHETETGHTFELDDNGPGRIKLKHNNGNYVEFDVNGNMITVVKKNNRVTIGEDNTVTIGGDCSVSVDGDCSFSVKGSFSVDAGDISFKSGASTVTIDQGKVNTDAVDINTKAGVNYVVESAGRTSLSGKTATYGGTVSVDFPGALWAAQSGSADSADIQISEVPIEIDVPIIPDETGFLAGLKNLTDKVTNAIDGIVEPINSFISEVEQGIANTISEITKPFDETFKEISKQLEPVTQAIDQIQEVKSQIRNSIDEIDRSFVPLERILGKELFPRTNFVTRALDDVDKFTEKLDRIYEPLVRLNLDVVNLNEQISTRILNEAYNPRILERIRGRTNKMNRDVHELNSYYNLSNKKRRIPHLGGALAATVPEYVDNGIETDFETYTDYADFGGEIYLKSRDTYGLSSEFDVGED